MADAKTIWHHPLGGHGTLKPGTFVKLTCLGLCRAARPAEEWTVENEDDHHAIWQITSQTNSDYCIEIPEKGRRAWVDFDFVEKAPAPVVIDVAAPMPAEPAPMRVWEGDTSNPATPEASNV